MPFPLTTENTRSTLVNGKRVYLVKVAKAQRVLIYIVLGLMLINGAGLCLLLSLRSPGIPSPVWSYAPLVLISLDLALVIAAIVQTIRLALASGTHIAAAIVAGVFLLFPWLGLIVVVFINVYATGILKRNGVHVGFLGVTAEEMKHLVIGACKHCGYDIRGLPTPQCPECGTPIPLAEQAGTGAFTPVNP